MRSTKNNIRAHAQKIKKHVVKHASKALHSAKHHFVPHKGNGYKPHVLKHRVLLGYSAILILLKILAVTAFIVMPSYNLIAMAITPINILSLTNQARALLQLPELKWNDALAAAATAKAKDMLNNQYFAHNSPSGLTPWYWIKKFGYDYKYSAENLAVHFSSAEQVQDAWLASASHKKNIIDPRFDEIGIGISTGEFEGQPSIFVVQMFGKPMSEVINSNPLQPPKTVSSTHESQSIIAPNATTSNSANVKGAFTEQVSEPSINIKPSDKTLTIDVAASGAKTVKAQVGDKANSLYQKSPQTWSGTVPIDQKSKQNEPQTITIVALNASNTQVEIPAAISLPHGTINELYGLQNSPNQTLLFNRFSANDINNFVHSFYFFLILFLIAALSLNIFINLHVQHIDIIGHTIVVICLAALLFFLH